LTSQSLKILIAKFSEYFIFMESIGPQIYWKAKETELN